MMDQEQNASVKLVGVIFDTHNLLRPEALVAFKDVDLIVHADDICQSHILDELKTIAPVKAVRGNHDHGNWACKIPIYELLEINEILIYIIHDFKEMTLEPAAAGIKVVISGHSHHPSEKTRVCSEMVK